MKIATAPGTWGVEPDTPAEDAPPYERVLDEIAAAGFDGSELGPLGYYPTDPALLADALARRELALPGGFMMEPLLGDLGALLDVARTTCAAIAAAGGSVLVLIDGFDAEREATAGRSERTVRLADAQWMRLTAAVHAVGALAARHGLTIAFHPHAGTHVEFADEIDRLLAETDVGLCLDTGHAAYAGIDPLDLLRRHGERLRHVHLKDLDRARLDACLKAEVGFVAAVARGVFTPLGVGSLDLAAVAAELRRRGYDGWATFEQDRTLATLDAALPEARRSLRHARAVGF